MIKSVVEKGRNIIKKDFLKRSLVISIIITNMFFYMPNVTFAVDNDDDEKVPATVPAAANEIISKFVSVKTNSSTDFSNKDNSDKEPVIQAAIKCHKYLRENDYTYGQIGLEIPDGIYNSEKKIDCSAYVSWVLYSAGYDSFKAHQETNFEGNNHGFKEVDINNVQPGDVLVEDGHVELAAQVENGEITRVYNCGWDGAIQSKGTEEYPETEEVSNKNGQVRLVLRPSGDRSSAKELTNNKTAKSEVNTEDKSSTNPTGTGEAKIEKCNVQNGGYDAIFTSGTTGRQFKEFKQNAFGNYNYPSLSYGCDWKSECGTVSTLIVGSSYSRKATIQDGADKLNSETYKGGTNFPAFLSDYSGQSVIQSSISSVDELKNAISSGSVAVIHDWGYSDDGHYLSILDISKDKSRVYISNPDIYGTGKDGVSEGWNSIDSIYTALGKVGKNGKNGREEIYFVTNDGPSVDYGAGGSSSGSSSTSSVNMSGNITEIKDPNNPNRSGYKINVDWDKEVEEMLETLKKKDYKLEKYLDKSIQKEYLKNMLKAAIVTQYPDLRSADEIAKDKEIPADETQGCIKIKRYADGETRAFAGNSLSNPIDEDDEDKGMYLAYMPYDKFSKLIDEGNKSAMNYFSMDSSNNLVVAGWETLDVTVSIEQTDRAKNPDPNPDPAPEARAEEYEELVEKKINYVNQVSNYTMPFSYLWSLLVYGNDEDFVNDVAKLVIDTEIVIASYDATNVKVPTYTNTYTKKDHIDKNAKIGNYVAEEGGYKAEAADATDKEYYYKVTEVHTLKTDTPSIKVKYANTWTAIYNNNYKVKNKDENIPDSSAKLKDKRVEDGIEYKTKEEIQEELKKDPSLQKKVDEQIEKLKEEVRTENEKKYGYRYEALTKVIKDVYNYQYEDVDERGYKLLYNKNIQDYIINMVIDYSGEKDLDTPISNFKENQIVINCAKEIKKEGYTSYLDGTANRIRRIVEESKTATGNNSSSLYDQLTKDRKDISYNKVYHDVDVTNIVIEETISKVDQKEKIETQSTKAEVEQVISKNKNDNVTMKTDKNSKENSFVKLLYHSKKAKGNLKIIDVWFFESMEETAAISDMVDLTKYLLQKVYNEKITYTQEEINEMYNLFDPEKFQIASSSNASNGNYSTDLEGFLFTGEGGDEYIDGDRYEVYDIGDGCLNIGHGVVIGYSDGTPWYPELISHPYAGQIISKNIYDQVFELKMKQFTDALDKSLAKYGVTLKQNQYDAMISFLYNTGKGNSDVIVSAYKNGGNEGFWNEIKQYINPPEYREGLMNRRGEEYELFIKGDYNYNPNYSVHKYY